MISSPARPPKPFSALTDGYPRRVIPRVESLTDVTLNGFGRSFLNDPIHVTGLTIVPLYGYYYKQAVRLRLCVRGSMWGAPELLQWVNATAELQLTF